MNALHLLWIIPLAASIGFLMGALMRVSKEEHYENPSDLAPLDGGTVFCICLC